MRLTRRVAIGVALVCGGLAALLTLLYLRSMAPTKSAAPPPPTEREVVVPLADIPANTIITAEMLGAKKLKVEQAPKFAPTKPQEIVGYVALVPLPADRAVAWDQVATRGAGLGLAGVVPPGMRAVTVPVDQVVGVAGLLKAGDRVDVIATFEAGDELVARTILQDIELLAAGTQTSSTPTPEEAKAGQAAEAEKTGEGGAEKGGEPKSGTQPQPGTTEKKVQYLTATLAVTPEDAQRLVLADSRGKLRLALRPVGEHDFVPVSDKYLQQVAGPDYVRLQQKQKAPAQTEKAPAQAEAKYPSSPWLISPPSAPTSSSAKAPKRGQEVEVIKGSQSERVVP
jgi:pilus assembly protein CpaB